MHRFSQSPLENDFIQNPYRFYEQLRGDGDLIYWEDYNCIFAVTHRAVNYFLRDRCWGREVPPDKQCPYSDHLASFLEVEKNSLLEIDPPRHTQLRKLVAKAFTTRGISQLEPYIHEVSNALLDSFDSDTVNLQKLYSERLPVLVITKLLGVDSSMSDQLLDWSHKMVAMYQANRNRQSEILAGRAASEFSDFVEKTIKEKIDAPSNDFISRLATSEIDDQKLSLGEMASTVILLLNAGHEATTFALGNGINAIVKFNHRQSCTADDRILPQLVEEILRFDPPLHIFERYAKEDVDVFGHQFKTGDMVCLLLAAANRDPQVFDNPDEFCPSRANPGHVSLGAGVHFCVGAPLARLEMKVALSTLFRRFPELEISPEPQYADRYHFHGFNDLWANLDSTARHPH